MLCTDKFNIIKPFLAVLDITILSLRFLTLLKDKMTDTISSATKPVKDTVSDTTGGLGGNDDGNQTNLIDSTQQQVTDTASQAAGTVNSVKENVQDKTGEVADQVSSTVPGSELVTSKLKELTGSHKLNDSGEVTDKEGNVLGKLKEGTGQLKDVAGKKIDIDELGNLTRKGKKLGSIEPVLDSAQQKATDATSQATDTAKSAKDNVQDKAGEAADQASSSVPGSELATSKLKELTGSHKLNDSGEVTDKDGNVLGKLKEGTGQLKRIAGKKVDIDELGNLTRKGKKLGSIEPVDSAQQKATDATSQATDTAKSAKDNVKGKTDDVKGKTGDVKGKAGDVKGKTDDVKGKAGDVKGKAGDVKGKTNDVKGKAGDVKGKAGDAKGKAGDVKGKAGDVKSKAGDAKGKTSDVKDKAGDVKGKASEVKGKAGEVIDQASSSVPGSELVTSKLKELKGTYKLNDSGQVTDKDGNVLANFKEGSGQLKRIAGKKVDIDETGNLTRKGKNLGSIEPVIDEEDESDDSEDSDDDSDDSDESDEEEKSLEGNTVREDGKVVNDEDEVVGQVVEGSYKKLERLVGKKVTSDHTIVNKKGKELGTVEPIDNESDDSEDESDDSDESDEEEKSLEGNTVREDGKVVNDEDEVVGQVVEGSYKKLERLVGKKVTSDHTIVNKKGRQLGTVEPINDESDDESDDGSDDGSDDDSDDDTDDEEQSLEGNTVREDGKVVNDEDEVVGQVVEGSYKKLERLVGKKVTSDHTIVNKKGRQLGTVEPIDDESDDESDDDSDDGTDDDTDDEEQSLEGGTVREDGKIVNDEDEVVGQVVEGSYKKLERLVGKKVTSDHTIVNKKGKELGTVEALEK